MPLAFPENISPRDEVPPYRQVADAIEAAIRSGDLRPGQVLPSESEVIVLTGVGRNTVRRAMARLRDLGLIRTTAKRGSYVSGDIPA